MFAVLDRGCRFLGRARLKYWPQFEETEVGWAFRRDAWGHGYATEAARACLEWGFGSLDVPYLTAMIHPDNEASIQLARRLGMSPLREDGDPLAGELHHRRLLMADVAAALRETRRVLRADGRVACAVFAGPEQNPWAALPSRVLQHRGHIPPPEAGALGILALADRDRLRLLFTEAGFADPAIEEVAFGFRFAGVDEYWGFLNGAAGAIAMVFSRLGEDERERIRGEIAEQVDAFGGSGQIELPATSLVVSAS
jgi:Acetyltransferase (GNAT) domain